LLSIKLILIGDMIYEPFFITVFLFVSIVSNIIAQKIDFSACLASCGGVHTSTPSMSIRMEIYLLQVAQETD